MNNKLNDFIKSMPKPPLLGSTSAYCMAHQIELYEGSLGSSDRTFRETLDEDKLTERDEKVLVSQKRLFDVDSLPPKPENVLRRLQRMILRHNDASARDQIADILRIADLELQADSLLALRAIDPNAYRSLMRGDLGTAIRVLSECQYPMRFGPDDLRDQNEVKEIVVMMARLWTANDLQNFIALCHVRIYRPTNFDVFDLTPNGGAPQAQGMASTLFSGLDNFDRLAGIFLRDFRTAPADGFLNAARHKGGPGLSKYFGPGIRGNYEVSFHEFARPASFKDSRFVSGLGLDLAGEIQLAVWRKAHGDKLEAHLEAEIKEFKKDARRLRAALVSFMSELPRNIARGNANGVAPVLATYLAIEHAISWTSIPPEPDRARSKTDDASKAAPSLDLLEKAVEAVWNGKVPLMPGEVAGDVGGDARPPKCPKAAFRDSYDVRRLFLAYRCAILEDPDFLPARARLVVCKTTGNIIRVKSSKQATEVRGERYTYDELFELSPVGPSPAMPRPLLTTVSNDVNRFRFQYARDATDAAKTAVEEARGVMDWRLIN